MRVLMTASELVVTDDRADRRDYPCGPVMILTGEVSLLSGGAGPVARLSAASTPRVCVPAPSASGAAEPAGRPRRTRGAPRPCKTTPSPVSGPSAITVTLPAALRNVARQMLEAGNPEDVSLRGLSRRIGISVTTVYRHFSSRDDLMASVAVEGFHELTAALEAAAADPNAIAAVGLAYLDFALSRRGMFRLMFGPLLAQRSKYPALRTAADAAFGVIERAGPSGQPEDHKDTAGIVALGLIHGISELLIGNLVP